MKKLLTLLLVLFTTTAFSQNVGISDDPTFIPDTTLHIDGSLKVGDNAGSIGNIWLANKLYDMDNSTYFIDPGSTSRVNGFEMNTGSPNTPSIFFNGYNTTGIYRPVANSIGFSVSGTEAMRITSSRNLYLIGNDITGVKQLHFQNGEIWLDGNPGNAGQVLKSDGSELYWDDLTTSTINTTSLFTSPGIDFWEHPDYDVRVSLSYTNSSSPASITVDNDSGDTWSVFITGDRSGGNSGRTVKAVNNGNSLTLTMPSSGATFGFKIVACNRTSEEGFVLDLTSYSTSRVCGLVSYW